MAYWKLDNGENYESHLLIEENASFAYLMGLLESDGIVVKSESNGNVSRVIEKSLICGQLRLTETRKYFFDKSNTAEFFRLKSIQYKAEYNGQSI